MTLEPGLQATFRYTVAEADTAVAVGSGEVSVLATPRVLALAERATVAAAAGALEAGESTVGVRVELEHMAPSVVGAELEIAAVLERVAGRRLEFAVRLHDGGRLVARGMITRVVVNTAASLTPGPGRPGERAAGGGRAAVAAPADLVYRLIADFDRHHPRFLPPAFSEFRVEERCGCRHRAQLQDDRRRAGPGLPDAGRRAGPRSGADRVR